MSRLEQAMRPRGVPLGYSEGDSTVHEVCPRTLFKLGVSSSGSVSTIAVAQRLAATDWVGGLLIVRLHEVATWTNTNLVITAMGSSFVESDPTVPFSTGVPVATVTFMGIIAAPVAPGLQTASLAGPIGPMLDVRLSANLGVAGTITVALSIDLIGRRR